MDQREYVQDHLETLRVAMDAQQLRIWTSLPGIVQSYDPGNNTVSVQPAIKGKLRSAAGVISDANLPKLILCPVVFPSGGGYCATFPIEAGDEVLVSFAARAIDAWWQSGGVQSQVELRCHDLSDGFAVPGPFSVPRVPGSISTTTAQLRSSDGTCFAEIDKPNNTVKLKAPTQIILDAPLTTITGVINVENINAVGVASTVNGTFQSVGDQVAGVGSTNISQLNHQHINSGGSGTGGPPLAGT